MREDDVTKDNVCFALSSCELVAQTCDHCVSGKKVDKENIYMLKHSLLFLILHIYSNLLYMFSRKVILENIKIYELTKH